jgi:ribosomal protein L24
MPGDRVRVLRGEDPGMEAVVLDLIGHAYRVDFQVVMRNGRGELVWYYPWDVVVVERAPR